MGVMKAWLGNRTRLMALSARLMAGRRYWAVALIPVAWPAVLAFWLRSGEKGGRSTSPACL